MSLKKTYSKAKPACKVTFTLAKELAPTANTANLAGEFNDWNEESIPMKKLKSGEFSVSVDLENGKEYQFKYIVDGKVWVNDPEADKYIHNGLHSDNSIVEV